MAKPLAVANSASTLSLRPAPTFALIIPTLREAANLHPLMERVRPSLDSLGLSYEIIVVDDDSRDGTEAIMKELARDDERIRLITRTGARGLCGAVMHGWQNTNAEVVGLMDSDLQHPPELLPQLWQALESGADVAVASRYIGQASEQGLSSLRHLVSRLAIWMMRPLQKPEIFVHDPLSGFFLVRRCCIEGLDLQPKGFKVLMEVLVRGKVRSAVEVPFRFDRRQAGISKAGFGVGVAYLKLLARLCKLRFSEKRS